MSEPFRFPETPHQRRHGPLGYSTYESYRPWVRDEFAFRCVFCLTREAWARGLTTFNLDHFLPTVHNPELIAVYDNLLYVCSTCNAYKRGQTTPDPLLALTQDAIAMDPSGVYVPRTLLAAAIIDLLKLNDAQAVEYRRIWIEIIQLAQLNDPQLHRKLMGYPRDLPQLASLRPPEGNTRPNGIAQSCYELQQRGELPETY